MKIFNIVTYILCVVQRGVSVVPFYIRQWTFVPHLFMPTYLTVLYIYFYFAHVYIHINVYNRVITLQSFEISHLLAVVIFLLIALVTGLVLVHSSRNI